LKSPNRQIIDNILQKESKNSISNALSFSAIRMIPSRWVRLQKLRERDLIRHEFVGVVLANDFLAAMNLKGGSVHVIIDCGETIEMFHVEITSFRE
jgi:hypothetical protein